MKKARVLLTLALAIALFISIIPVSNAAEPYSFGRDYISQGDANLDGRVNSGDALYILKYVRGDFDLISDMHKNIADANGDGVIDISDAIELLEAPSLPPHAILAVPVYIGDVNLDGVISASDANLLLRYCNGLASDTELALILADCNWDGVVDTNDVLAILDYIS